MGVYLAVLAVIFACIWITRRYPGQKTNRLCAFFCCFLLVLVAGFRYRVGTDALLYQDLFEIYPKIGDLSAKYVFESRWAPLFVVWFSFCHTLFDSFIVYQFIYAAILTFAIYLTLLNNTKMLLYVLALYFVYAFPYFTFDLCREGLAMSIFLYGFYFLQKKKIIVYFVFAALAYLTHPSSVFVFFVPLLTRIKLTKKNTIITFVAFLLGSIVAFKLVVWALTVLPTTNITYVALRYLKRYNETEGLSVMRLVYCTVVFYMAVYKNLGKARDAREQLCFNIAFVSILIMCLEKAIPYIFRLNTYFILFFFIAICSYVEREVFIKKHALLKFVLVLLICCSVKVLDYAKNKTTYNAYIPYVSVFDPHRIPDREWHGKWQFFYYDQRL